MNAFRCLPLALLGLAACPSTVGVDTDPDPNDEGEGEGGGGAATLPADACALPADGATLTITVRNTGDRDLSLDFGCFDTPPIEVDGQGIAPGAVDICGIDCREVWDGYENLGCSTTCGANAFRALPPGGEVAVRWDRRLFVAHLAPPECTGHAEPNRCGFGEAAPATGTVAAVVGVCPHGVDRDGAYIPCAAEPVPFTLDLADEAMVVDVE
ncbi:MAG: hypothetical protein AAF928_02475 [Myxococcota bacterium]